MSEGKSQIKAGVVLSFAGIFVSFVIPFLYTPVMLQILGQEQYGLYGIASSCMSYLNLLNFGISGSMVRYIVKYASVGDVEGERRIIGLFIKIYSVIAILTLICGTALSFNLSFYERSLNGEEFSMLKVLLRLLVINTAVFLPMSPMWAIIISHEKFVFNKLLAIVIECLTPVISLILLYNNFGVIGIIVGNIISNCVNYLLSGLYIVKKLHITPVFHGAEKGILSEILHYSFFVFLGNVVNTLYWSTDKLIIGWALGTEETAIYNIGSNFNGYFTNFSTAISGVLMPKITSMAVKNTPKSEFTNLFVKVGRIQFIVLSFVLSAFIVFGRQFINIWVGEGYEEAYGVALFVLIPIIIPLIQNTGLNMLYALNKHCFRSISYACIAILNVILTFILVESYGIIGAAEATCIAYIIGHVFLMNWYYHRKIGIDIPLFWKNIVKMSPVMIVCGTAAWFILDRVGIGGWGEFFLYAVIYSVVYLGLAYIFMMNDYERSLLSSPVRKILRKLKRG